MLFIEQMTQLVASYSDCIGLYTCQITSRSNINFKMSDFQLIGPSSKNQGPYKFYKGFKYTYEGKERSVSLGHFFFIKILDDVPICIGELQLAWEDKHSPSELASVKLYFVPEDTPEGRLTKHGQVRKKIYIIIYALFATKI